MTRIVITLLVAAAAMMIGAPRSIAVDVISEPLKSESACNCIARHQSMARARDSLKALKAELLIIKTDQTSGPLLPTEEGSSPDSNSPAGSM